MKVGLSVDINALEKCSDCFSEYDVEHIQIRRIFPELINTKEILQKVFDFRNKHSNIEISHHAYPYNFTEWVGSVRNLWIELAKKNIKFASDIGCKFITFHLGCGIDAGKRTAHSKLVDLLIPVLYELTDSCIAHNIEIHIENMYSEQRSSDFCYIGDRLSDFIKIFETIDSASLKLCYDYGHANLDEHGIDILRAFPNRLGSIHAHDNDQISDIHFPIGKKEGTINWIFEMKYLKDIRFNGTFIFENSFDDNINALTFMKNNFIL